MRRRFSERNFSVVNAFEHSEKKSPSDDMAGHKVRDKRSVPLGCLARSEYPTPIAKGAQVEAQKIITNVIN